MKKCDYCGEEIMQGDEIIIMEDSIYCVKCDEEFAIEDLKRYENSLPKE